jgi:hypothetical protein
MAINSEYNPEDHSYFEQRLKGRLYLSKEFTDKYSGKKKRFAHKVTESDEQKILIKVKDEILLETRHGGRHQLKALLIEDPRSIQELVIQKFSVDTGNPHKSAYSFRDSEIRNLYNFLRGLYEANLSNKDKIIIDDASLDAVLLSAEQASRIVNDNQEILIDAIKHNITKTDIVALGYRKQQLEVFKQLLDSSQYFDTYRNKNKYHGDESVWQHYFEQNTWIMGYGLSYIFNSPLDGEKLEQVVSGATIFQSGKRIDALLKTRGIINSICFAEIKTHKTHLLKQIKDAYRGESWAISDELAGAIAQVQRTIQKSIENLKTKTEIKDSEDNLTGENLYLYKPKAFLVIGSLYEFVTENGINESKYSSFELFRKSMNGIEIITFDELFERASFIVKESET